MSTTILNTKFKEGFTRVQPLKYKKYPVVKVEIIKKTKRGPDGRFIKCS